MEILPNCPERTIQPLHDNRRRRVRDPPRENFGTSDHHSNPHRKPTSTSYARIFYPVPESFIVTKNIFKGAITTMQPPNVQNITGSTGTIGTMKAVKTLVATTVQTVTDTLYGVSSVASTEAVPDSTCPWPEYTDYTADSTAASPEPCGE
jgi:hypothetical protein